MTAAIENRQITSYLKGVAIMAVLVNHYSDLFISRAYGGYANSVIAIFFILSGYGIFQSFEKTHPASLKVLGNYFLKRFLRLYPLFWISMAIHTYYQYAFFPLKFYLLPSFRVMIIYWFINAIIQCYALAPLFYFGLKKIGGIKFISIVLILLVIINYCYPFTYRSNELFFIRYKKILFSHIFLFTMGMALPGIIHGYRHHLAKYNFRAISFLIFVAFIYMTMQKGFLFAGSHYLIVPFFLLSAVFFCFTMISNPPKLPLSRVFVLIGMTTYSLYLFHHNYYGLLSRVGWIEKGNWATAVVAIVLFPIFFLLCYGLENLVNKVTSIVTAGPRSEGRTAGI